MQSGFMFYRINHKKQTRILQAEEEIDNYIHIRVITITLHGYGPTYSNFMLLRKGN